MQAVTFFGAEKWAGQCSEGGLSFHSQFNCEQAKQGEDVTRSQAADCQTLEGHGKAAPLR